MSSATYGTRSQLSQLLGQRLFSDFGQCKYTIGQCKLCSAKQCFPIIKNDNNDNNKTQHKYDDDDEVRECIGELGG